MKYQTAITSIGILTANGKTIEEHRKISAQTNKYYGYSIYSLKDESWQENLANKSHLRQMSMWQKMGCYAAKQALATADCANDITLIVAASGGNRDIEADEIIAKKNNINNALSSELRPTLFLTQLANLLAGNIAMLNNLQGRSITVMGMEEAGKNALELAFSLASAGQTVCVGASFFADSLDMLLNFAVKYDVPPLILGSGAVFFIIEPYEKAILYNATIYRKNPTIVPENLTLGYMREVQYPLSLALDIIGKL